MRDDERNQSPTLRYFNLIAPQYDAATANAWSANRELEDYLRESKANAPASILDLGSGTGQTVEVLRKFSPDAKIVAVDGSLGMLKALKAKYANDKLIEVASSRIEHYLSNSPTNEFELVTCVGSCEFLQDISRFVQDSCRVLSPAGILAFTYEPLIRGYAGQENSRTESAGSALGDPTALVITYRWSPHQIDSALSSTGMEKLADREFVAYVRFGSPVIYHLVICRLN